MVLDDGPDPPGNDQQAADDPEGAPVLPRPRDQVATRESPEFLRLRRKLYDFIHFTEAGGDR